MTIVRAALLNDFQEIAGMHERSWRCGFQHFITAGLLPSTDVAERHAFWVAHLARSSALILVAEGASGVILGACAIDMPSTANDSRNPAEAEIEALYVDPTAWRSGTGRSLLAHARPLVRANGHRAWALWTLAEHLSTRAFYNREGFTVAAHRHRQHEWGAPLVRLHAPLRRC